MSAPVLEVRDLKVKFATEDGMVHAVDGVSYTLERGRTLGLVGESGSGKSISAMSILGLTRAENATISGQALLAGTDLLALSDHELQRIRGNDVAMIFQDPLSSLHPFYKVGDQLVEMVRAHQEISKEAARGRAVDLLGLVRIPDPRAQLDAYPHQFSGGIGQRVMIAIALANEPKVLIADEPTSGLDVTVQAEILELIDSVQAELNTAVILVTHDLGVVAENADEIAVMYAGRIVEHAPAKKLFTDPGHPYTWGLLESIPRLTGPRDRDLISIGGAPPSLIRRPTGCSFHPRCPYVLERHRRVVPPLEPVPGDPTHRVACLLSVQVRRGIWRELQAGQGFRASGERVELTEGE